LTMSSFVVAPHEIVGLDSWSIFLSWCVVKLS
jgi:hypothetical protein